MSSEQEPLLDETATEQIDDSSSESKISPIPLLPALFLHILAYTQVINLTQQWLLLYICQNSQASDSISWEECRKIPNVQASTAKWEMTLSLLANIPSLLSVPLLGKISDRIGRKPIMLLPVV
jgi:MFS family permease